MWQKAEITKSQLFPHAVGKGVWVRKQLPTLLEYDGIKTGRPMVEFCYPSQLYDDKRVPEQLMMPVGYIRLLEEFAENVPMIPYETWSREDWKGCE